MPEKQVKTRIIHKHDFEANWIKATAFIPMKGELIIYDIEVDDINNINSIIDAAYVIESDGSKHLPGNRSVPMTHVRFKIGDGKTSVSALPFAAPSEKDVEHIIDIYIEGYHPNVVVPAIDAAVKKVSDEAKEYIDEAIASIPEPIDYSVTCSDIEVDATETSAAYKRHTLSQNGKTVCTIDVPRDLVVKSGRVDKTTNELVLILINDEEIRVDVSHLIEYVTGGTATDGVITVNVSDDFVATATIANGSIKAEKFADDVDTYVDNRIDSKLDVFELTDESVKLNSDLKTYYNVGKIINASGTNPITIGNKGDTLRKVFDNLFNMDEIQPTITQNPSVSCTLSSSASDERGTEISSISYSISFNDGKYTNADNTGVKMTNYSFSSGTASSNTATSGTITLPNKYIVGTSPAFSTTITANHDHGDIAKTNLGNDSNPEIKIAAGSVSKALSFSKTAVDYPYYVSSDAETVSALSDIAKAKKTANLVGTAGETCNYNANAYVWIFVRKGSSTSQATKTIQAYSDIAKEWGTFLGGTQKMGEITFNKQNSASDTFYAYRTINVAQAADSAKFRLQ